MSDLISRQAVLDGIDKYIEKAQSTGAIDDFNSFAELVVKALPSVENKAEWLDDLKAKIVALPNANPSYWYSGDMVEREEVLEILDNIGKESEGKK